MRLLGQCELDIRALDAAVLSLAADTSAPLAAPASAHGDAPHDAPAASAPTEGLHLGGGGGGGSGSGGAAPLLVASPSSARGLDVHGLDLVVIMGVPHSADAFVHLAGRTGRQVALHPDPNPNPNPKPDPHPHPHPHPQPHLAGRTGWQGAAGRVVVLTTPEEADAKLPLIGSQLGLNLAGPEARRHVAARDERWAAEPRAVHSSECPQCTAHHH